VASFADWYNQPHRHSGIKFVTPNQRHSGQTVETCRHRAVIYEQARQRNPLRWSRASRYWRQPEVVWINPPSTEIEPTPATLTIGARTAAGAPSFLAVTGLAKDLSTPSSSEILAMDCRCGGLILLLMSALTASL
jgi:hypothetical protein